MFIHKRNPLDPKGGLESPASAVLGRRRWLKVAAFTGGAGLLGAGGLAAWRQWQGSPDDVLGMGLPSRGARRKLGAFFPAPRDERFKYGREETLELEAARYTNFYEFSQFKWSWRLVQSFQTDPWTIRIDGLCRNPLTLDVDAFIKRYAAVHVERQYRHRCVETWAMAVPWSGIPLARVLRDVDPLAKATHVRFVSFNRPSEAPGIAKMPTAPWPYVEGLTLGEAVNELTFLATGMYGHPLLKQHGAPIRLVVPWKYGFKSIKSIERIELVAGEPSTFWSTLDPKSYPFESNVDPAIARPWTQTTDRMLGTDTIHETQLYNGYQKYVAHLYPNRPKA